MISLGTAKIEAKGKPSKQGVVGAAARVAVAASGRKVERPG